MESSDPSSSSSEEERIKKRKHDKHKKHKSTESKKHKKSKHRKRRDASSSSEEDMSCEDQWVEASTIVDKSSTSSKKLKLKKKKKESKPSSHKSKIPVQSLSPQALKEEEDEWSAFGNMLPTFSNDSKRSKKQKEREEMRELSSIDMAGQSEKELNPYWKDGGKGLPTSEAQDDKPKLNSAGVGDGGLAWLKKSFERAKQQAKDAGRPVEEIVAERWGSLETFYTLLEEAENKAGKGNNSSGGRRRDDDYDDDRRKRSSFKRPSRHSDNSDEESREPTHRDRDQRYSSTHRDHRDRDRSNRDRNRDSGQSWRKPGYENKRATAESENVKVRSHTNTKMETPSLPRREEPIKVKEPEEDMAGSDESDEQEEVPEIETPSVLTDKEMNELNAKLFKAEMLGDSDTVSSLQLKISEAEKARQEYLVNGKLPDTKPKKVITKVILGSQTKRRTKDKPTESHVAGQRVRYFPDDDKHSLKSMFEKEKMSTVEDENAMFSRLMAKSSKATEDYDADDIFVDKASSSRQAAKEQKREIENLLYEEKAINKVLENCNWCFDGKHIQKNLIVSIGQTCFLCVPPYQSLTEGHCLIVPMSHVSCTTELDEDVWTEIQKFRKALVRMFFQSEEDVIFFERAVYLKKQPHMYLECVPMPKETGELAPIYFKKAIQECETEWSQNKKVVDLKHRDVRKAIPKGLPYFSVEFGDDSCGFAHVIEDEKYFPANFAQEIIGGMMELDHKLWRKQTKDDFNTQRTKLMNFLKVWGPFDFTREDGKATV